jgi:hypothetical protein
MITICHLMYYPPGVRVDADDLRRAAEISNEGFGWAIAGKAMLWNDHDLTDAEEMITEFTKLRNGALLDRPAAFHSRWATTGTICEEECHPVLTPDRTTGVFLNGTLDYPLASGGNDTAELAHAVSVLDLDDPVHFESVNIMARRCNARIVVLAERERAWVFNREAWLTTPYGALASNADHMGEGTGWARMVIDGDEYRYNLPQPGDCARCTLHGHDEDDCANPRAKVPFRWRNVSEHNRKYGVRA